MELNKLPLSDDLSLLEIARVINMLIDGYATKKILNQWTAQPPSEFRVDGTLVYADGTSWDPGSGEGFYAYYNSTWNKL